MRALYYGDKKFPDIGETYLVTDDKFHHYTNVLKIRLSDQILLLDGMGGSCISHVSFVDKKHLSLKIDTYLGTKPRKHKLSLIVGKIKKENMDLVFKQACEIGFESVMILNSQYSIRYALNSSRIEQVLISALEQSNNLYLPKVIEVLNIEELDSDVLSATTLFHPTSNGLENGVSDTKYILIGPEGGFSDAEFEILSQNVSKTVSLPTGILRAPTACTVAAGYMLRDLMS